MIDVMVFLPDIGADASGWMHVVHSVLEEAANNTGHNYGPSDIPSSGHQACTVLIVPKCQPLSNDKLIHSFQVFLALY